MLHFRISPCLCPFTPLPAVRVNKLVHTSDQGHRIHLSPGIHPSWPFKNSLPENVHYIRVLKNKKQPLGYMSLYGNKFILKNWFAWLLGTGKTKICWTGQHAGDTGRADVAAGVWRCLEAKFSLPPGTLLCFSSSFNRLDEAYPLLHAKSID